MQTTPGLTPGRTICALSFLGLLLLWLLRGWRALAGHVREELVHQAFQHDRGLRELDLTAVFQIGFRAARAQADVFPAEQALGLDARVAVLRNFVESRVDPHLDRSLVILRVEMNRLHLADAHSGHADRRAWFEIADVVEFGGDVIALRGATAELQSAARQLRSQKEQRSEAEKHEQAGADFE